MDGTTWASVIRNFDVTYAAEGGEERIVHPDGIRRFDSRLEKGRTVAVALDVVPGALLSWKRMGAITCRFRITCRERKPRIVRMAV